MNYVLKMFDNEKVKFFDELNLDCISAHFFLDDLSILDDVPAVGFRSLSFEPLKNKSSAIEKIDYFLRVPNSNNVHGLITFDSCLSVVKSYMMRSSNSVSSRIFGSDYDFHVGFSKRDFLKPKTIDLKKFGDDFFYFLSNDTLDLIKRRYLK
jgi:hypothetical protein